jgi:hypothetical protein
VEITDEIGRLTNVRDPECLRESGHFGNQQENARGRGQTNVDRES